MSEPLTVRVRWSADVEATAAQRFQQSVTRVQRAALFLLAACALILFAMLVYSVVNTSGAARIFWGILTLFAIVGTAFWPVMALLHAREFKARTRRMARQAGEVEWAVSPGGIEYRAGPGPPAQLKWERVWVTRFADGFVLAVEPWADKYWLPADAFPDSAVVGFAELAQQRAARYSAARPGA